MISKMTQMRRAPQQYSIIIIAIIIIFKKILEGS